MLLVTCPKGKTFFISFSSSRFVRHQHPAPPEPQPLGSHGTRVLCSSVILQMFCIDGIIPRNKNLRRFPSEKGGFVSKWWLCVAKGKAAGTASIAFAHESLLRGGCGSRGDPQRVAGSPCHHCHSCWGHPCAATLHHPVRECGTPTAGPRQPSH